MSLASAVRRTHERVWRDSFVAGEYEAEVFRPVGRAEMALSLEAAERFDREHKGKGDRNGPIGHVGLEVYRALWRRVNFMNGRCDPSLVRLMADTRRSRQAVVEALKRLWDLGLVRWIRRLVYTGRRGIAGPQVEQATNAYELRILPEDFLDLLPKAKRARYAPKGTQRQPPPRARNERSKKSTAARVWAAWGRMSEAISEHLMNKRMRLFRVRLARYEAMASRESTERDQTMPSPYKPTTS